MTPAILTNYFFVGARLREHLATIPELAAEGAVQLVENLTEQGIQRAPTDTTAFVSWDGDIFPTGDEAKRAGGGRQQSFQQVWTVILAVRDASQTVDLVARNAKAGKLLGAIQMLLGGWKPSGAVTPLQRAAGRKPSYPPNAGLYPLTFQIQLFL